MTKKRFAFLHKIISSFSYTEKIFFWILIIIFSMSSLALLVNLNKKALVTVPKNGGTLREGIVGPARFINPTLAQSDTDLDLTSLIYSGLMRVDDQGNLIPDLADSYTVSEDGLEYTFKLKSDAIFHDDTDMSADDVIFTIQSIQDPTLKSPRRSNWDGIDITKIDDDTIIFTLQEPYEPFIWNTTIGILPKHIWGGVLPEEFAFNSFNTSPIGSGPFYFKESRLDKSGTIKSVLLKSNRDFTLGRPYIETLELHIFKNNEERSTALKNGFIDLFAGYNTAGTSELNLNKYSIIEIPMNRIFGVFFNQNKAQILAKKYVRSALEKSINREALIDSSLHGFGTPTYGPVPQFHSTNEILTSPEDNTDYSKNAQDIFTDAGWKLNENGIIIDDTDNPLVSISLSTADIPELVSVASTIVDSWRKAGIDASLKVFDVNDLRQTVIRPREYDTLLFGEVIDPSLDLYAFWHSSQRNDPGLNIANYTNITVDNALEKIRSGRDEKSREELLEIVTKELENDIPGIFLYSPNLLYVTSHNLKGVSGRPVTRTSDRFSNVHMWYTETDKVWKIFSK